MKALVLLLLTATPLAAQTMPYTVTAYIAGETHPIRTVDDIMECAKRVEWLMEQPENKADKNTTFGCEPLYK